MKAAIMRGWNGSFSIRKNNIHNENDDIHKPVPVEVTEPAKAKGTCVRNFLQWFHPYTWIGLSRFLIKMNVIHLGSMMQFLWGVLMPLVGLTLMADPLLQSLLQQQNQCPSRWLFPIVFATSPWSIGLASETLPQIHQAIQRVRFFQNNRMEPLEDALIELHRLVDMGRVIRAPSFDLYLPPLPTRTTTRTTTTTSSTTKKSSPNAAIPATVPAVLLIPGLLVHHASYAPVASLLSQRHHLVVVVPSLEPLRISCLFDTRHYRKLQQEAEKKFHNTNKANHVAETRIKHWSLVGHSMGGYTAMELGAVDDPPLARNVVVWAAGHNTALQTDLRKKGLEHQHQPQLGSLSDFFPPRILVIQASCDAFCRFPSKQSQRDFHAKLPLRRSRFKVVRGGNHGNFASYPGTPIVDGVARISRQKQQQIACAETAKFLMQQQY